MTTALPKADGVRLSVVVPCYNEEGNIAELYRRLSLACQTSVGTSYEIILVNDGSKDRTWEILSELANRDARLVVVNLSRNYGHQLALTAGLHLCVGQRILILDADLQDPPELLSEMMKKMDTGCDVVYGKRKHREGETPFKIVSSKLFYRFLRRLIDIDIPLDTGDFRLLSRRALEALNRMPESHRFIRGMVSWIGFRQEAIPYERAARFSGETKYPLTDMIRFALDAITSFSVRPLRWASHAGIAVGVAALFLTIYVLYRWATGNVVEGWTSLMLVILILGSGQLMVAGMFGEYLGRLYMESKHRPLFIIQDIVRAQTVVDPGTINAQQKPS